MAQTIDALSSRNGDASQFRIWDGAALVATIPAAHVSNFYYTGTVPDTLPAGHYAFSLYLTSDGSLRAVGDFHWDGSDVIDLIDAQAAQTATLIAEHDATQAALTAQTATLIAEHDATQAALTSSEAALLAQHTATQTAVTTAEANVISEIDANETKLDTALADLTTTLAELGDIENLVDTLEAGQTSITDFVDTLETGQVTINAAIASLDTLVMALPTAANIADAVFAYGIEDYPANPAQISFLESMRQLNAVIAGNVEVDGNTITFKSLDGLRDRLSSELDPNCSGERTNTTDDLTTGPII